MRIGIFGSTGFIGSALKDYLSSGHDVIAFTRTDLKLDAECLAEKLRDIEVIINLVGAPLLTKRWTSRYKEEIISSRVEALKKIHKALIFAQYKLPVLISASAVGIYKQSGYNDEASTVFQDDFVSQVVRQWEAAAMSLEDIVERIIIVRLGIVLGKRGGALKPLIKLYKTGLGGVLGSKKGIFPYISLNDLVRAFLFLTIRKDAVGIFNLVEPGRITNKEFSFAIANAMKRFAFFDIPAWLLKLLLGERANVLLSDLNVFPKNLMKLGFEFKDSDIVEFLKKEIKRK